MPARRPPMSAAIRKYYDAWLAGPGLRAHASEEVKFYQFVKACIVYGKRSHLSGAWLRAHLSRDLPGLYKDQDYIESQILKAVRLFETLKQFHRARFPNRSLEGKDVFAAIARGEAESSKLNW